MTRNHSTSRPSWQSYLPPALQRLTAQLLSSWLARYLLNIIAIVPIGAVGTMMRVNPDSNLYNFSSLALFIMIGTAVQLWRAKPRLTLLTPTLYVITTLAATSSHDLAFVLGCCALLTLHGPQERGDSIVTALPAILIGHLQFLQRGDGSLLSLLALALPFVLLLPWKKWRWATQYNFETMTLVLTVLSGLSFALR